MAPTNPESSPTIQPMPNTVIKILQPGDQDRLLHNDWLGWLTRNLYGPCLNGNFLVSFTRLRRCVYIVSLASLHF
jgi:hypothetical protein